MSLEWLFDFSNFALVGLLFCVFYAIALAAFIRRMRKEVVCPVDHKPHEVQFEGTTLDQDHWWLVRSCSQEGGPPLCGRRLHCSMTCLEEPDNCPRCDLQNRVGPSAASLSQGP